VIEFLSQREGGGQLRFPMMLGQLKFDNKVLSAIKNLYTVHRSRAERQIAQAVAAKLRETPRRFGRRHQRLVGVDREPRQWLHACRAFLRKAAGKLEWYRT